MRRPSRPWLLVPITGGCMAWATVSVLAVLTDSPAVGANTFTTANWGCTSPGTSTVTATADSWTDQLVPVQNSGADSNLRVQSSVATNRRSLVRFSLPAAPAGCSVTAATLRMYDSSPAAGRTVEVYRAASPWSESAATWLDQPGTTGTPASSVAPATAGWQQWVVTAQVIAQYGTNNGFVVRDSIDDAVPGQQQVYYSREHPSNPPELIVTFG